jgi:hypothetical protein
MRYMIKGLVAAFAVMTAGAAPASACGYGGCCGEVFSPCATTYAVPTYAYEPAYTYAYASTPAYSACGGCGAAVINWGYERLAEPSTQYYYVNQGPTYSGPGAFAPVPTYQEDAAPGYYGYHHHYHDGYAHHYRYFPHHWGYRYGGGAGTYWGHHLVRRYY